MKNLFFLSFLFFLFLSIGCGSKVDIQTEKAEILKILANDDKAMLEGKSSSETANVKIGHDTYNIMKGKIEKLSDSEIEKRNKGFFDIGKVIEIQNLDGPYIHFSPDAKTAWVSIQQKFIVSYKDSLGQEKKWDGIEARLIVYEKINNKWIDVACAQTF